MQRSPLMASAFVLLLVQLYACGGSPELNRRHSERIKGISAPSDDAEANPTKSDPLVDPLTPVVTEPAMQPIDPVDPVVDPIEPDPLPEPVQPMIKVELDCSSYKGLVHQMFGDSMVLQRNAQNPIWGCTQASQDVTVSIAGKQVTTKSNEKGLWKVRLPSLPAGGPHDIKIEASTEHVIKDVLVGDVFLCSGQSNMFWKTSQTLGVADEVAKAGDFPDIRLFQATYTSLYSKEPAQVFPRDPKWARPTKDNVSPFSAVCYFTGKALHQKYKIPIGLIHSSLGGTRAEAWTSADFLKNIPESQTELANLKADKADMKNKNTATVLFNHQISPIFPYGVRAVLWYQGESNEKNPAVYKRLLPNMIADWRDKADDKDLPFLLVQLAGYRAVVSSFVQKSPVPELREVHLLTSQKVKNVGIATAVDLSVSNGDIHPNNKKDVAFRLAIAAENLLYQAKVPTSPVFKAAVAEGNKMTISFDDSAQGLMPAKKLGLAAPVKAVDGKVLGFGLAGADGVFHDATALIAADGKTVSVTSKNVGKPVSVRYGWAAHPTCNLYSKFGLPVIPFRSDLDSEH